VGEALTPAAPAGAYIPPPRYQIREPGTAAADPGDVPDRQTAADDHNRTAAGRGDHTRTGTGAGGKCAIT